MNNAIKLQSPVWTGPSPGCLSPLHKLLPPVVQSRRFTNNPSWRPPILETSMILEGNALCSSILFLFDNGKTRCRVSESKWTLKCPHLRPFLAGFSCQIERRRWSSTPRLCSSVDQRRYRLFSMAEFHVLLAFLEEMHKYSPYWGLSYLIEHQWYWCSYGASTCELRMHPRDLLQRDH